MCGWRRDADNLVEMLDQLVRQAILSVLPVRISYSMLQVESGSELHILSEISVRERAQRFADSGLDVRSLL